MPGPEIALLLSIVLGIFLILAILRIFVISNDVAKIRADMSRLRELAEGEQPGR